MYSGIVTFENGEIVRVDPLETSVPKLPSRHQADEETAEMPGRNYNG